MLEFIIARTDGDYFDLHTNQYANALHPTTFAWKVVEGWGEWRIEVRDCEIAFSGEPPGYQITFDCEHIEPGLARDIIEEILSNIEKVTGQRGKVIAI